MHFSIHRILPFGVVFFGAMPLLHAQLNVKEDGGAAVYGTAAVSSEKTLVAPEQAGRFPIAQQASLYALGGGVRGFGMLARYDDQSSRKILVARKTKVSAQEPYTPIALVSVFDPDGNAVVVNEWTDQPTGTQTRILDIPAGKPGIWRISFSGGRQGDLVEIRLPKTEIWGVRGEMSLGVRPSLPKPAYLWIPPSSEQVLVGVEPGSAEGIVLEDADGKSVLARSEPDPAGRAGRLILNPAPAGRVVRLGLPASFDGALVVEGAPGLWCPTEKAALNLRGGAVQAAGLWVAGPLQARAREWMTTHAAKLELNPKFVFPEKIPADLGDLYYHMLAFQKGGPLNNLDYMIERQNRNLDPNSPYFGSDHESKENESTSAWKNFRPGLLAGPFQASSLAAAAAFDSPLNPAYGDKGLAERSALAAFYHFTWLQGDGVLRESDLFKSTYPMTHAFFVYENLAQGYLQVRDILPEDASAIWRQGLLDLGGKLADFQGYQPNQWAHVIEAHLYVYLATGEKRFLGFFERLATAYLDNTFGPHSKFGQHPAGYYLEQGGPDGNYDKLNSFTVSAIYYEYRTLPEANPALVEKLRLAIEKNLRFASFFWLPRPDGEVISPNAFNCRTMGGLGNNGYPGQFLPKSEFPLAAARYAMTPAPQKGVGNAAVYSWLANNEGWIRRTLEDGLKKGTAGYRASGGNWLPVLKRAFSQPPTVEAAPLPINEAGKTWELPGLFAFNKGGIYGVSFYDVIGANSVLPGITGGGPTALWTPATGSFLSSMHAGIPPESLKITDPKALTFACVFGHDEKGEFFYSGKERAELRKNGKSFVITSKLSRPFATLHWRYQPMENGLELGVCLNALQSFAEGYINLPLATWAPETRIELVRPNELHVTTRQGGVVISWSENNPGELVGSKLENIRRLLVPLPKDGGELKLQIRVLPAGPTAQTN